MSDGKLLIHVRFAPDATVTEIGERPASLSAQQWFDHLTRVAGTQYQPLSGGRGVFRITREELALFQPAVA